MYHFFRERRGILMRETDRSIDEGNGQESVSAMERKNGRLTCCHQNRNGPDDRSGLFCMRLM